MTANLLEQKPPEDPVEWIHFFAKTLAYGMVKGLWSSDFVITETGMGNVVDNISVFQNHVQNFTAYIKQLYLIGNQPLLPLNPLFLETFGYLNQTTRKSPALYQGHMIKDESESQAHIGTYRLTTKAMDLLNTPHTPPSVFISYHRPESSAFGLLVLSELLRREAHAYIDKNIHVGAQWEAELETRVREAKYMVLLLAPQTLQSPYVQQEIRWAVASNSIILPVTHNGFSSEHLAQAPPDIQAIINTTNWYRIKEESALEYDQAINSLLNSLGYV